MEFFILIRDEGSYWPPGKLDCLSTKKKTFSADSWQVLNQILGCADTEPPTPVTYDLHGAVHKNIERVFSVESGSMK